MALSEQQTHLAVTIDRHVHLDRRQFNHLMGVVRSEGDSLVVATGTRGRLEQVHLGGAQQGGAGALVSFAPSAYAAGLAPENSRHKCPL